MGLYRNQPAHDYNSCWAITSLFFIRFGWYFSDPRVCYGLDSCYSAKVTMCMYIPKIGVCAITSYSWLSCWTWIILHTIVIHDPWVCHDLEPRSYLHGNCKHRLLAIIPVCMGCNCQLGYITYFRQFVVHGLWMSHDFDPRSSCQGHSA